MKNLALMAALLAACGSGSRPNGSRCAGATQQAAANCAGQVCIGLKANLQNAPGICSEICLGTCRFGGQCVTGFPDGNNYCLRPCATSADCLDGFICLQQAGGGFCFVQAIAGGVDCSTCAASMNDSGSLATYCANTTGATQVCDCPNGAPSASCIASPSGANNVFCCP